MRAICAYKNQLFFFWRVCLHDSLRWAVAISKPCQERKAAAHLAENGFVNFIPLLRKRRRIEPLFPGYVFVQLTQAWRLLLSTKGVFDVVRMGATPATVGNAVIAQLRARCDAEGFFLAPPRLKPGIMGVLTGGPFVEKAVKINRLCGRDRVEVLMQLLGQEVRFRVEESLIAA
jgi:transcriptional antiterminator RfaH